MGSIFHGGSFWRTNDGERIYNWNHSDQIDDRIIISADIDSTETRAITADASSIVLWDINSGRADRYWTSPAEVLASKLGTGGRYAMLGLADHSAVIFDAVRGGITRSFYHKGRVRSVDMSENNQIAITGSEDHTAAIWQLSDGQRLFTIKHEEDVQLVRLSPNGQYALTAAKYDSAKIWNVDKQTEIADIPLKKEQLKRGIRLTAASFSEDNRLLLLGYPQQKVELRELPSLNIVKTWTLPRRNQWQPSAAAVIDVAFDKHRQKFWAMSSNGFIHLLQ